MCTCIKFLLQLFCCFRQKKPATILLPNNSTTYKIYEDTYKAQSTPGEKSPGGDELDPYYSKIEEEAEREETPEETNEEPEELEKAEHVTEAAKGRPSPSRNVHEASRPKDVELPIAEESEDEPDPKELGQ